MEERPLAVSVGKKIAELRKERGLTQRQLADKIYTSDKNLSKWETGKAMPDLSFLLSICSALGVKIEYFTSEDISAADILNAQRRNEVKKRICAWAAAVSALAGVPLFLFAAARAYLPARLPVHFDSSFNADRMGDVRELAVGITALFALTAAALIGYIIYYIRRPDAHAFRTARNINIFGGVFLFVDLISLCAALFTVITCARSASAMGIEPPAQDPFPTVITAVLGCVYWLCGCVIAFIRRNEFIGFRIPSAYESDFNWRAYNTSGGVIFIIYSSALALAAAYMPRPLGVEEAMCAVFIPLIPAIVLSYFIGRAVIRRHEILPDKIG